MNVTAANPTEAGTVHLVAARHIKVQPSSPLRRHGFVNPVVGMARITERGETARLEAA